MEAALQTTEVRGRGGAGIDAERVKGLFLSEKMGRS